MTSQHVFVAVTTVVNISYSEGSQDAILHYNIII